MIFTITKILYDEFKADEKENYLNQDEIKAYKNQFIKPLYPHEKVVQKDGTVKVQKYSMGQICC